MRRKAMRILNRCMLVAFTAAALSACIKSDEDLTPCNGPIEGELELRFATTVSAASTPTRALSGAQEDALDKVDVLVFDNNGTKYAYRTYGTVDPESNGSLNRIRVKVLPTGSSDTHSYVLLGNLRSEVEELFASEADGYFIGTAKQDLLDMITFEAYETVTGTGDNARTGRRWDTDTPKYLPMWGETGPYAVNTTNDIETINTGTPVKMLRAIAKIDIAFIEAQTKNKFLLTKVMVYHANQTGQAVPLPGNMAASGTKADKPTMPAGTTGHEISWESILYEVQGRIPANDPARIYNLTNSIYITEHINKGVTDQTDRLGIIIGGIYDDGGDFTTAPETWYRVDFYYKENPSDPLEKQSVIDILRNHHYTFVINEIGGRGYPTPDEAIETEAINIDNDIVIWEDYDMGEIAYDGHYFYSVTPREITFQHYGSLEISSVITVRTNNKIFSNIKYDDIELNGHTDFFVTDPPFDVTEEIEVYEGKEGKKYELSYQVSEYTPVDPSEEKREVVVNISFTDGHTPTPNVIMKMPVTITQYKEYRPPHFSDIKIEYEGSNVDPLNLDFSKRRAYVLVKDGTMNYETLLIRVEIAYYQGYIQGYKWLDNRTELYTLFQGANPYLTSAVGPKSTYAGSEWSSIEVHLPICGTLNFTPIDVFPADYTPYSTIGGQHEYYYKFSYSLDGGKSFIAVSRDSYVLPSSSSLGLWHPTDFYTYWVSFGWWTDRSQPPGSNDNTGDGYWFVNLQGKWGADTPMLLVIKDDNGNIVGRRSVHISEANDWIEIPIFPFSLSTLPRTLHLWYSYRNLDTDLRYFGNEIGINYYVPLVQTP